MTYGDDESYTVTVAEGATTATATLSTGDVVTITPAATAKITHVAEGEVDNAFTYTVANSDQYSNKAKEEGTLTVTPAEIKIVTDSGEKEYDGKALTAGGKATFGETETTLKAGEDVTVALAGTESIKVKITGTQTPVGESNNTYEITWGTVASTDYKVNDTIGKLEVKTSTKELKVASADGEWTYDSTAHTKYEYTVTYGEETYTAVVAEGATTATATLSTGDVVTITPAATATITHVDETTVDNTFTWTVENSDFYTKGTDTVGELTVTPAEIKIVTDPGEKEYDGTALTADGKATFDKADTALKAGEDVEVALAGTEKINVKITGTQTPVGRSDNTYVITWGETTSTDYEVTETVGKLEVTASTKELKVVSADGSWTYDGNAHTKYEYTVTYGTTETHTVTITGDATTGTATLSTGDVVTITPAETATITDVAESKVVNAFTYTVANDDQYSNKTKEEGDLEITKRSVTLTSGDATKPYDGTALTNADVEGKNDNGLVVETGWAPNEGATYEFTGSQIEVGGEDGNNYFTYTLNENTKASNYNITKTEGTLTVTDNEVPIVITSGSNSWMYNGENHDQVQYTVTYGDTKIEGTVGQTVFTLPTGDKITISGAPTVKNVSDTGEKNNTFSYVLENADYYKGQITSVYGNLAVTPRSITMTSATDSKKYDGKPLTNHNVTVTGDGFVDGEGAAYDVTGSQTKVGNSQNEFTYTLNEGTLAENYTITPAYGTLTVSKSDKVLTIVSGTDEWMYNGADHSKPEYTVTYGVGEDAETGTATKNEDGSYSYKLSTGDTITITDIKTVKNVSDTAGNNNTFTFELENANQYETVSTTYGTLTITPRTVVMTSASAEKEYDGNPLTRNKQTDVTVTGDDFVDGEGAVYTITGTQTVVGNSPNSFTYKLNDGTLPENYTITTTPGTLTVTQSKTPIVIESDSKAWTYDNKDHSFVKYTVTYGDTVIEGEEGQTEFTLPTKDKIVITNPASVRFVSDTKAENNTYRATVANADQYETITLNYGTLTINPRELSIVVKPQTYEYNGKPQGENNVTYTENFDDKVSVNGLQEGDTLTSVTINGQETDASVYAGKLVASDAAIGEEGKATGNYKITYTPGTLTITKKPLEITANGGSKTYDGTPITAEDTGYTITDGSLVQGQKETVTLTGEKTLVGTETAHVDKVVIMEGEKDVTKNYDIKTVDGTLEVTDKDVKPELVITKKDKAEGTIYHVGDTVTWNIKVTNIYDKEQKIVVTEQKGVTLGEYPETLAAGASVDITATHVITADDVVAKSYTNTATAELGNIKKDASDTVKTETIKIEITAASDKKVYDSTPLTNDGYKLTNGTLAAGNKIDSVTVTGTQTLVGESANVPSDAKIVDAAGDDVTRAYTIAYKNGTLEVTDGTGPDEPPVKPELVITKTDKAAGTTYHVGDTVTWTIKVTNIYDKEQKIVVTEQNGVTLGEYPETLAAGASVEITATHVITVDDVVAKSYTNTATAELGNIKKEASDTVKTEPVKITITAASDKKVYDSTPLTNDGYELSKDTPLVHEDTIKSVTVTGSQTLVGESDNVPSEAKILNGAGEDVTGGYDITYVNGTLTVTDGTGPDEPPVDPELVITKTDGSANDGVKYHVGDTVTWTIKVTNIYDEEKTIEVTEQDGVVLGEYPKALQPGESVEITATHVITGDDVEAGTYTNTAKVKLGNIEPEGHDTVETEPIKIEITAGSATKVYDGKPLTSDEYKLSSGELAEGNKIDSVTLTGSQTVVGESENVPSEAKIVDAAGADTTKGYEITYKNGTLKVTPASIEPEDPKDPEDPANVRFKVTDPEDTMYNGLEQKQPVTIHDAETDKDLVEGTDYTITYSDDVIHVGEVTITITGIGNYEGTINRTYNITKRPITFTSASAEKVYDGTALVRNEQSDVTISGEGLAVTDSVYFDITGSQTYVGKSDNEFTYEFSEKKEEGGAVAKALRALGLLGDAYGDEAGDLIAANYEVTVEYGTLEVTDDGVDTDKVIKKTHDGQTYAAGETVEFEITVTNIYDRPMTITVIEQDGVDITGESVFENVAPGETKTTTAEYVLTEEDVLSGSFKNVATAEFDGDDEEGDDPAPIPSNPDEVENFAHMTVEKTITNEPKDGKVFRTGETIRYEITVTNDGTKTMTDIVVEDELTGDEWKIASLKPGAHKTFDAEYVVTKQDGIDGEVTNVATAIGNDPDGDENEGVPGEITVPTDKAKDKPSRKVPKTGDDTQLMIYMFMMSASLLGLILAFRRRKKDRA